MAANVSVPATGAPFGYTVMVTVAGLAAARLSFRELVATTRIEAARSLLIQGDAKIAAVAREVGCSSASQLGVLLRRAGEPMPSTVRASGRQKP